MLYSYKWLQSYFDSPLPPVEEVKQKIIFQAFEVEGVEEKNDDKLLDIKILPDRAHDCLCHFGVAQEVGAIFNLPMRANSADYTSVKEDIVVDENVRGLKVEIKDSELCRRYCLLYTSDAADDLLCVDLG